MAAKIYWTPDLSQAITSFTVYRSDDKGASYTQVALIPFNVAGPNYDKQSRQFFYDDSSGDVGFVYRIVASGNAGDSDPLTIITAPAEPSLCTVIGYVRDALGFVDQSIPVFVEATGSTGERWIQGPEGIVAQNGRPLLLQPRTATVHPNEHGLWQVDVMRGAYVRITIPALSFVWAFEVPNVAGPVNVKDLPQLRGKALELFGPMNGERLYLPES